MFTMLIISLMDEMVTLRAKLGTLCLFLVGGMPKREKIGPPDIFPSPESKFISDQDFFGNVSRTCNKLHFPRNSGT